jgi:hypothetical protein
LVHGVSGAAKTSTITLAGAALGEAPFCLANQKTDNFGEAIGSASRCSSLIVADEVFKSTGDKFTSTMRPILLAMGRRFDYRQLNIGTVSVQFNSAVFLCDTDLPEDLPEDEQFGRRFVYVNAPERTADWQKTGVDLLDFWRHTPEHRRAFDSLYSDLIDRFFGVGSRRSFQDIAEELGFLTYERYLLSTETGTLLQEKVIEVFWAVVDPANDKLPDHHKQGRGYCVVDFANHDHRITQALEALGAQAGRSIHAILPLVRKYNGRWHQLVNAKFPGRFDVLEFKGKTYVRFAHGETKGLVVNEQLADPIQLAQRQQKAAGQGVSL